MSGGKWRLSGRGKWLALLLGVGVAVAIGVIVIVENDSSSPASSGSKGVVTAAIDGHSFLPPECAPIQGRRWVYPGTVEISSTLYESFALNYPCASAATWTKRLIVKTVPFSKTGVLIPVTGPPGFRCGAWADATRHAYAGGCQKGTEAFGWNWNVANPHDYFIPSSSGRMELSKGSGSDVETVLRTLASNRYELDVSNTSGIGYINRFAWSPPPGWTITAVTKTTGGSCALASAKISCHGSIGPPACLCAGAGGDLIVDFTITSTPAKKVPHGPSTFGSVGSTFQLTPMTPVPFLVPGTPQEAQRQRGE